MGKKPRRDPINPYLLFVSATLLMAAGFLMGQFPVLIFCGLAPLFAITDRVEGETFWNRLELVGLSVAVGIFAAHTFAAEAIVISILEAIAITIAFAAFTFTRQQLGQRLGKLPLIFYLLSVEYISLKTGLGSSMVFFADAFKLKTAWTRWTSETGYIGISLWILLANLFLYLAVLRQTLSIPLLLMFVIVVVAPILYSYSIDATPITRQDMLLAYSSPATKAVGEYSVNGEWIPRTATWVSALILMFVMVRTYTAKK